MATRRPRSTFSDVMVRLTLSALDVLLVAIPKATASIAGMAKLETRLSRSRTVVLFGFDVPKAPEPGAWAGILTLRVLVILWSRTCRLLRFPLPTVDGDKVWMLGVGLVLRIMNYPQLSVRIVAVSSLRILAPAGLLLYRVLRWE